MIIDQNPHIGGGRSMPLFTQLSACEICSSFCNIQYFFSSRISPPFILLRFSPLLADLILGAVPNRCSYPLSPIPKAGGRTIIRGGTRTFFKQVTVTTLRNDAHMKINIFLNNELGVKSKYNSATDHQPYLMIRSITVLEVWPSTMFEENKSKVLWSINLN